MRAWRFRCCCDRGFPVRRKKSLWKPCVIHSALTQCAAFRGTATRGLQAAVETGCKNFAYSLILLKQPLDFSGQGDKIRRQLEGFPSGQREQTVNLPRKLRRFESFPLHQILIDQSCGFWLIWSRRSDAARLVWVRWALLQQRRFSTDFAGIVQW